MESKEGWVLWACVSGGHHDKHKESLRYRLLECDVRMGGGSLLAGKNKPPCFLNFI